VSLLYCYLFYIYIYFYTLRLFVFNWSLSLSHTHIHKRALSLSNTHTHPLSQGGSRIRAGMCVISECIDIWSVISAHVSGKLISMWW